MFHKVFERWLYSFSIDVETPAEYKLSKHLLDLWLAESEVVSKLGHDLVRRMKTFLIKSFYPPDIARGLVFYERISIRNFELHTSSNVEAEGAVTKRSANGPRPNMPIDVALKFMEKNAA
jgi:hypothetical protein